MRLFCFKCKKETDFFGMYVLWCGECKLTPAEARAGPLRLKVRPKNETT